MQSGPAPLEILLVTGPLGAGKTTVVNRLLKAEVAAKRRVAVLINEFGSISVDGSLVASERPELAGVENLVNGCACCSLRSEAVDILAQWCDRPEAERPQRVVLETIYELAGVRAPPVEEGAAYTGYPLRAAPLGAAWLFYLLWPTLVIALWWWRRTR